MKFSIITVSYQSADTLEDTIKTVLEQTYPNIEYLVIDGGSADGSVSILSEYSDQIDYWVSEPDAGMYDAMNKAIDRATGDVIGFLHADDLYTSNEVIQNVASIMESSGADACYADLIYVNDEDTDKITRVWKSDEFEHGKFLNGWMPPHPTFFVKRDIYKKYGSFRTDFGTAADYELMLRFLYKYEIAVVYHQESIVKMRTGGQSNASIANRLIANRNDKKAWLVNGLQPKYYTLWLKPLRKISQFTSTLK